MTFSPNKTPSGRPSPPLRSPPSLSQEDLLGYAAARMAGTYQHPRIHGKVSARRTQADLQALRTACNWAYATKRDGTRLVSERVFDGLTIPAGKSPKQPAVTEDIFGKLWAARRNPELAVARVSFQQWMSQGYKHAGLVKPRQVGWHGFRRGFTTRNSVENTKAAMNLAGMKNLSTFTRYQQPGDAEYLSVLNNRPTSFAGQPLARDKVTP